MSALVSALLVLLPEAFALFKGRNKQQAAEDFALSAIDKAKGLLGVSSDTEALQKIKENPAVFQQWQTEMNAQARAMVAFTESSAARAHETYRMTGGVLANKITHYTLRWNPVLAFSLLIGYYGSAILMAYLQIDQTTANVINTVVGPMVGGFFQQLMQERDRIMTFAFGADYTDKVEK